MNKNIYLIALSACMAAISCQKRALPSSSTSSADQPTAEVSAIPVSTDASIIADPGKVLFINLEFFKKPDGKDTCVLMNSSSIKGRINGGSDTHHHHADEEEMVLSFLSCAGVVVYEEHIPNPLSLTMDTYEETGKIGSGKVTFERREVGLRVQEEQIPFCNLKIEKKKNNETQLISFIKLEN